MKNMKSLWLTGLCLVTLALSACSSIDRSTASANDYKHDLKVKGADR